MAALIPLLQTVLPILIPALLAGLGVHVHHKRRARKAAVKVTPGPGNVT